MTEAIHEAAYNSNSRLHEQPDEIPVMAPSAWRADGTNTEIHFVVGECSLGSILVAKSAEGICAILLGDHPEALLGDLQDHFPRTRLIGCEAKLGALLTEVVGFVEVPGTGFDLPLGAQGTAFQQRVWQALREIPAGSIVSYTEIARRIGAPKAVRAVAGACAANALAVAIPCHRVVRADGALSGYRWGMERKRALLASEVARAAA
jgi:AraC family transcriptional regulator of adaptative response/methylated-DNA-[protein]-cysteine methyltransferase